VKHDSQVEVRSSNGPAAQPDLRAAWLCLLLVAPCFVLAFVLLEAIVSRLGYGAGSGVPPTWVMLASVPALLACAIPTIPTWRFGHRARRSGARHALLPFGIAVALVVAVMLLSPFPLLG
jgi:hypothetical protein